ncbi:MAG: hypothetical protein DRH49_06875 [Candidatus Coatesbacteria bacterium]|nr:MAG: hypothetical protein DRH49_06875 [Candidatus Coatesbacteria bacterium]
MLNGFSLQGVNFDPAWGDIHRSIRRSGKAVVDVRKYFPHVKMTVYRYYTDNYCVVLESSAGAFRACGVSHTLAKGIYDYFNK